MRGFAPIVGSDVKERLTGAIILVALIVLLVPELLRGPFRVAPRAAAASAGEEPPLRSYTINLADDTRAHGTSGGASGPEPPVPVDSAVRAGAAPAAGASPSAMSPGFGGAEAAPQAAGAASGASPARTAPATAVPATPPVAAPATAPASAPAAHTSGQPGGAPGSSGAWMVQLGSFASRANAERLARQVRSGGFKVSVSQGSSGRRLYRVRVGPVRDRDAAAQLASRLRAAGHGGAIVPK